MKKGGFRTSLLAAGQGVSLLLDSKGELVLSKILPLACPQEQWYSFEMIIRREEEADWFLVHALNTECFETPAEALLVDALREQIRPYVAMVAEEEGLIVGHVMFSPALLENHRDRKIMALAPLAVEAEYRRRGIAAELVRHGLHACKELGYGAVVVVGDPKYYPRFGFLPSPIFQLKCEFEIPAEAFLVIELQAEYLKGCSGTIKYPPAFSLV